LNLASSLWNKFNKREIGKIERFRGGMEYEDRLNGLGYTDIEYRRKRGDFIKLYKISKGFEEVELGFQ